MTETPAWEQYLSTNRDRYINELLEFIRIPSISALPENSEDVQAAGCWTAGRLERAGLENVAVLPTGGHPVAYGDWLHAPGRPTILIYGHFDVQPADPLELWDHPPFEPEIIGDRIYARGASDDKGNLMSPITAVEALLATGGSLPLNVKFLIEGQEEISSPQMEAFLANNREHLACDLAVSADGLQWSPDQPQIEVGARGMVALQIDVRGPAIDQHSGLYGGVIQNPAQALAHILASFHDSEGRITVDGFYDDAAPITLEDREMMARPPFSEEELRARLGVDELFGEPDYTPIERAWARPTLEICGLGGGFQGEGEKSIIPSRAMAKISCRLVPGQKPGEIIRLVKRHIARHTLPGVKVEISEAKGRATAYLMPADHPGNLAAAKVLSEIYDKQPFVTRSGGTIAVFSMILDQLGVYTVGLAFSHEDENLHGPNEFFRLGSLDRGQKAYVLLLHELAGGIYPRVA
jgi:acetylornithine deacetylase/succinyl-diaminopimelate desuccinylase-like protein